MSCKGCKFLVDDKPTCTKEIRRKKRNKKAIISKIKEHSCLIGVGIILLSALNIKDNLLLFLFGILLASYGCARAIAD